LKLEKLKLVVIGLGMLIFVGCIENQPKAVVLPNWIKHPKMEGYYVGTGSANPNNMNDWAIQKNEAKLMAMRGLSENIKGEIDAGGKKDASKINAKYEEVTGSKIEISRESLVEEFEEEN